MVSPHEDNPFLWAKSRKQKCTGEDTGTAVTRDVLLQGSDHNQWCVALYFELNNSYCVRVGNYPHYTIASFWLLSYAQLNCMKWFHYVIQEN